MKEDNTPTVTARRRIPSAKQRLRLENAKRLKALNQHSKTVRQKKKEAKRNKAEGDPEEHVSLTRLPKVKKNNLAAPPTATSKFQKRQVHKSWLPTHLWHTKRAHMSKPSEPLWRMAIPMRPTEKSYRPSHRASGGRGCIAWDMSYVSTIGCKGNEASLDGMLKAIGFHGEGWSGTKYNRWKKGSRSAEGWVFERDNDKQAVAPVIIIWDTKALSSEKKGMASAARDVPDPHNDDAAHEIASKTIQTTPMKAPKHHLFIRIHPSGFHQFWLLLLKVAKIQRPQVIVEDLRFEIGSIEITGPGSTEALLSVLKPVVADDSSAKTPENVWRSLGGLSNPASLPHNCLLAFDVCDPRLSHPPKPTEIPKDVESANDLTNVMVSWPPDDDATPRGLFSHKWRRHAVGSLPSQKSINRRKTLAPPGHPPTARPTDPRIPVLILAGRPPASSSGAQGTWTVLLPWKCVDAVWRSLMYYPLSSGGTPRFGGLDQKRQICFEHGEAWYPGDAAGTEAGQAWERTESAERFDEWMRRPASRRIAWDTVNLGNGRRGEDGRGWACDWNYLLTGQSSEPVDTPEDVQRKGVKEVNTAAKADNKNKPKTQRQRKLAKMRAEEQSMVAQTEDHAPPTPTPSENIPGETSGPSSSPALHQSTQQTSKGLLKATASFVHLPAVLAVVLFKKVQSVSLPALPSLTIVRIKLLTRGTPTPCARIYRLPSLNTPAGNELRKSWLALDPVTPETHANSRATKTNIRIKKDRLNHRGNAKHHTVLPFESLDCVNYIPAHPPPEYFQTPEHRKQVEAQAAALAAAAAEAKPDAPTAEQRARLLEALMVPVKDVDGNSHPACPGAEDLIGFVTSGAYNLAEGRGTAVGSVWVQRVVEGWRAEDGDGEQKKLKRRRRLCVVRNAGESVGRLGLWELSV